MNLKSRLAVAVATALCLVQSSSYAQDGDMPPALVKVGTASVQPLAPTTLVPGTVASRDDARLAAEVVGRLVQVADVGTPVEKGGMVARIEDTQIRLYNEELAADVARTQARLEFLVSEEKRYAKLAESNLAAQTQLEQTRSERDMASGDLRVAQSRLAQNQDQLARTTIRAPFSGVVVERLTMPGERVDEGQDVVRLVDQQHLEIVARAPLDFYPYVREGMRLGISAGKQQGFALVRRVVALGGRSTHQFEMRLDIEDIRLPVGQALRLAVPMADPVEVLSVPRDALVLRPEGITVFIVGADDMAQQVSVTTGIGAADRIEVQGDLSAGDRVIIRGNERLQPGQKVTVQGS
jgi:RND family efflux transporter MFP subunit